jgi:TolA-binding protein
MVKKLLSLSFVLFSFLFSIMIDGTANADMVAYYKFEGDANDSSGNNLHGIGKDNISYVVGVSDQALDLDSKNSYMVDCGTDAAFDIDSQITVACWIKVKQFDREWQTIIAKGDDSWRFSRNGTTNQLHFACNGLSPYPPWVNGNKNVNDGKWHHAAGVYDGAKMYLYVDGIPDASRDAHGTIDASTFPVYIGENAQKTGRCFKGLIDELTIFNHALNSNEIKQLYSKETTSLSGTTDTVWSQVRTVISNIKLGNENAVAISRKELLTNFSGDQNIAEAVFQVADTYRKVKEHKEARQLYQHIVDNWPDTKHALLAQSDLIKSHLSFGEETTAQAAVDKLLSSFSNSPFIARAVHDIAQQYRFSGKYQKANHLYQHVIDHWPKAEHALWSQADLIKAHLSRGDAPNAEAAVGRLLVNFTDNPLIARAVWDTAQYYRDLQQYEKANPLYQHVLDNWPKAEHALWAQADLIKSLLALGRDATAEAAVERLLADFTDNPLIARAIWDTGNVYRSLKKYEKANQLYQHIIDNWPKAEHALLAQADLIKSNLALGDDTATEAGVGRLLSNYTDNPLIAKAVWETGNVYRDLKKYAKAKQLYQYSADNRPENYHAMQSQVELINLALQQKDDAATEIAIDKLLTYFAKNKDLAQAVYQVGHGYINKFWTGVEQGESSKRLEYYEVKIRKLCNYVLTNRPDSEQAMWAQRGIAFSDIHKGDFAAAEVSIEKLLSNYPNHKGLAEAFKWLGDDYRRKKKDNLARQCYQRVIDKYSDDKFTTVLSHVGIACINIDLGDDTTAESILDKLITDYNDQPILPQGVFIIGEEYYNMAFQKKSQGLKKASNECFAKAIDIWQRHIRELSESTFTAYAWYYSAAAYRGMGQLEKTIEYFQKVVSDWPGHELACNAQFMIGQSFEQFAVKKLLPSLEAEEIARAAYQQVLDRYPKCPNAEYARRWIERYDSDKGGNPK